MKVYKPKGSKTSKGFKPPTNCKSNVTNEVDRRKLEKIRNNFNIENYVTDSFIYSLYQTYYLYKDNFKNMEDYKKEALKEILKLYQELIEG